MRTLRWALTALAGLLPGACQTSSPAEPAVLEQGDEATITALKQALAKGLGRAKIELGAGDPTIRPEVTVLPPPPSLYETRSLARPTVFQLELRGSICFAISDEMELRLDDVRCIPAG